MNFLHINPFKFPRNTTVAQQFDKADSPTLWSIFYFIKILNLFLTCHFMSLVTVFLFLLNQQKISHFYSDCIIFGVVFHPYIKKIENNLISLWTIIDWIFVSPQNSYTEILTPNVMRRWGLWWGVISSWGSISWMGLVPL